VGIGSQRGQLPRNSGDETGCKFQDTSIDGQLEAIAAVARKFAHSILGCIACPTSRNKFPERLLAGELLSVGIALSCVTQMICYYLKARPLVKIQQRFGTPAVNPPPQSPLPPGFSLPLVSLPDFWPWLRADRREHFNFSLAATNPHSISAAQRVCRALSINDAGHAKFARERTHMRQIAAVLAD